MTDERKETDRWDLWWYCDGTEEVYYEKPDDCGDPGSYRRHDACRWVRLVDATPAEAAAAELSEAAQDWAEDAYDRDYQGGDS